MADALQTLIDKQALHELVLRYCRACDRRDFVLLRSLYHDDAIDDHGAMFCGSADEFLVWLPPLLVMVTLAAPAATPAGIWNVNSPGETNAMGAAQDLLAESTIVTELPK